MTINACISRGRVTFGSIPTTTPMQRLTDSLAGANSKLSLRKDGERLRIAIVPRRRTKGTAEMSTAEDKGRRAIGYRAKRFPTLWLERTVSTTFTMC